MWELAQRLRHLVEAFRPDILHAHSPVLNAIPALRVGKQMNVPVLYEIRASWEDAAVSHGTAREGGLRYRLSRAMEDYAAKRAHAVATICEGMRSDLVSRGVAASKITVIPNGVDLETFDGCLAPDTELAARFGLANVTVLGFFGSFYSYEGLDLLIRAMPRLLEQRQDIRLLLIGGGPEEANLRNLAAHLDMDKYVVFGGRVPHADIPVHYHLADIMVYPRLKPMSAVADLVHNRKLLATRS